MCIQQENNYLPSKRDEYQMEESPSVFQTSPGSYNQQKFKTDEI